ncbi:MAG TPA: ABC transporter permease [Natronosporangium sp.]
MTEPAGVIHDIGYQRYQGERLGRRYVVSSLWTHSLRTAYGFGRTAKAKIFPWLVAGLILSVAVVGVVIRAVTGEVAISYLALPEGIYPLLILFAAVVAPELVSRELRTGVLSLYFSRPLSQTEYALAKLAALVAALWLLLAGPLLLLFLGGVFSVDGWSAVWDEIGDFVPGLLHAGIHALLIGSIALLIASLIGRRAVAAGAIVAAFLMTTPVVVVLSEVGGDTGSQLAGLFSPSTIGFGVRDWLFGTDGEESMIGDYGPVYGLVTLALVGACVGLLVLRYRRMRA